MVKLNWRVTTQKCSVKGQKLSKTDSKKLHIHGNDSNLSPAEVEQLKKLFKSGEVKWIKGGTASDIKKALHEAVNNGVLLLQKGMHFMAVLSVNNDQWYTFERQGGQIAVCRKDPGNHELQEIARLATIPASN